MQLQERLRREAKQMLEQKQVDLVIGYEDEGVPLRMSPCFITDPAETDRLVWNAFCHNNLTKYLVGRKERVAVVAKSCDLRSLVVLIKEKQVDQEKLKIIGVPCLGIVDPAKIEKHLGGKDIKQADVHEGIITVRGKGFEKILKVEDFLHDSCLSCEHRDPDICDVVIGEKIPQSLPSTEYDKVKQIEAMSPDQRWEFFKKELSRCIRCYACRNACPLCYCKKCFIDQSFPAWLGKSTDISDTMAFQIMRALHTAGRCVDCGACVRACPNNIDIRMLTKKVAKDVKELFDSEAGVSLDEEAPLTVYREDDPQDFIK
ncbi:MAG: Coenzyme F420 hydrogenase/dehydrogenase, beta subunit C-terminal domain [Planctomycetota bacterium]